MLGAPPARLRGITGELARENAMRNPKRTAASASALMIGVGLVAFITIFASSTRASVTAAVDRAFTGDFVIDSGAGFAGGVDPLGIGNTLARSIFERTRELGLLRAVGMTRAQVRSAIRWESVIIALQGTVLGLVIGLFFGCALVGALRDQGIDHLSTPVMSLLVVAVLAVIAGVAAAVLPGRRAAKLDILRAVVSE